MDHDFDVIVAGGGISGVLAAARIALARPEAKIALIEKERGLGGRLRGSSRDERVFGYGLNAASDALYEFWRQTLHAGSAQAEEGEDLGSPADRRQQRFGVLAGNRIAEVPIEAWFTAKGARTLGGLTAAREWTEVEEIFRSGASAAGPQKPVVEKKAKASAPETAVAAEGEEGGASSEVAAAAEAPAKKKRRGAKAAAPEPVPEAAADDTDTSAEPEDEDDAGLAHPVAHYWKKTRKSPAAVVLEHFGYAFGIPDIWTASAEAVAERARYHAGRLHAGFWDAAIKALTERPWFKERVLVFTDTRIVDAAYDEGVWTLSTEGGWFTGKSLVVAQPPWTAITWLKRSQWPAHLLHIASKTKPVSVVVLSEFVEAASLDIPEVVLVPSEKTQIVRNGEREICFQATIDFELSLSAPAVVKAVRQLKRARKKLTTLHPGSITETNHIALLPVAWAQSPTQSERRWLSKLDKKSGNTPALAFCGDAYGVSYDGDDNVLKSVQSACEAVLG